jgi:hypothetical protein
MAILTGAAVAVTAEKAIERMSVAARAVNDRRIGC